MTLASKIREALEGALRRQDKTQISTLRLLLSEMKNAEIAQGKSLDDDKIIEVISKEVKRRRESIEAFKKGNRNDLVSQEEAGLDILMGYLPQQMNREEIIAAARQTIYTVQAEGIGDKGKVMSQLMPQLKGKADGKEVSDIVMELLSSM